MNLTDWLQHIEGLHARDIELGLDRLREVAGRLNVCTAPVPVVTVAGTNGKGSTVALIEHLARAQGLRAAVYTSPHIHSFSERMRIGDVPCAEAELVAAFERVEQARGQVPLTYFEFTTLAALVCFRGSEANLWILEVGLGGRLDAVNLIDPDVAVVTSVGLDHMDWLGHTRELIAREKAGIARAGRPLIYGEVDRPATIDEVAAEVGAQLYRAGDELGQDQDGIWWQGTQGRQHCQQAEVQLGRDNLATAVQAMTLLGFAPRIQDVAVAAEARLPGRGQRIMVDGVEWLFDVGHNREAVARLVEGLSPASGVTHLVVGMLGDKPALETFALLASHVTHWYLLGLPGPRGLPAGELASRVPAGTTPECFEDAGRLCRAVASRVVEGDRVLVLGSFLTVAAVAEAQGWNLLAPPGEAGQAQPDSTQ